MRRERAISSNNSCSDRRRNSRGGRIRLRLSPWVLVLEHVEQPGSGAGALARRGGEVDTQQLLHALLLPPDGLGAGKHLQLRVVGAALRPVARGGTEVAPLGNEALPGLQGLLLELLLEEVALQA